MNSKQARFILQSYRPNGGDARDPVFREALEQAGLDPELRGWLEAETRIDSALGAKLTELSAPPSLLDNILAARQAHQSRPFWLRSRPWFAIAAVALAMAGLITYLLTSARPAFTAFVPAAIAHVSGPMEMGFSTRDPTSLNQWISTHGLPAAIPIPAELGKKIGSGVMCSQFQWKGEDIALICFMLEGGRHAHFFVLDASAVDTASLPMGRAYAQQGEWATVSWVEGGHAFVLAAAGDQQTVEALL